MIVGIWREYCREQNIKKCFDVKWRGQPKDEGMKQRIKTCEVNKQKEKLINEKKN